MESFKRGWAFLQQSWKMAMADRDLIKPTLMGMLAGFIVSLVLGIPIALVGMLMGGSDIGNWIMGLLGAVLVFVQYLVSYVFSGMTIYLIYGYLSEGDGRMDKAWAIVKRDFVDIISLAAASTAVNLIKGFIEGKGKSRNPIRSGLANLLDAVWTQAVYLVLPAMVIEDANLKDGLKRAGQIVKDNLVLVGVSFVGVRLVTNLIGFLLGGTGIALGIGIGLGLVGMSGGAPALTVVGITLGVLIAFLAILAATALATYTTTAYNTCLYLWARDVERARLAGQTGQNVAAPAPLAAVLGQ
jgi:hypothetical protein